MKMKRILVCDGSLDGILTAVYKAYDMRYGHEYIQLSVKNASGEGDNFELFSEYYEIKTDYVLSMKVAKTIRQKISSQAYEMVVRVALSESDTRADLIYRFIILGLSMGKSVVEHLSNDIVHQMQAVNRYVGREAYHFLEFLRFQEVGDGILLGVIQPKNHIISLMMDHFADRLYHENFIIYDEGRQIAVIHEKEQEPFLIDLESDFIESLKRVKSDEEEYENLWRAFHKSIAIQERKNLKLQRNLLPLWMRKNMTEFQG